MPGAVLTPTFQVSGTYVNFFDSHVRDRNLLLLSALTLTVTATKGGVSYPFTVAIDSPQPLCWTATPVNPIPVDTGYTITASVTDGTDVATSSIETVDVANLPVITVIQDFPSLERPHGAVRPLLLPLGTKKHIDFDGAFTADGVDGMFGVPYTLIVTSTTTALPTGGRRRDVTYQFGSPVVSEAVSGNLDNPHKQWHLKKINVEAGQFVMVFLSQDGAPIAMNASHLF
jgi:hypothetical protein